MKKKYLFFLVLILASYSFNFAMHDSSLLIESRVRLPVTKSKQQLEEDYLSVAESILRELYPTGASENDYRFIEQFCDVRITNARIILDALKASNLTNQEKFLMERLSSGSFVVRSLNAAIVTAFRQEEENFNHGLKFAKRLSTNPFQRKFAKAVLDENFEEDLTGACCDCDDDDELAPVEAIVTRYSSVIEVKKVFSFSIMLATAFKSIATLKCSLEDDTSSSSLLELACVSFDPTENGRLTPSCYHEPTHHPIAMECRLNRARQACFVLAFESLSTCPQADRDGSKQDTACEDGVPDLMPITVINQCEDTAGRRKEERKKLLDESVEYFSKYGTPPPEPSGA